MSFTPEQSRRADMSTRIVDPDVGAGVDFKGGYRFVAGSEGFRQGEVDILNAHNDTSPQGWPRELLGHLVGPNGYVELAQATVKSPGPLAKAVSFVVRRPASSKVEVRRYRRLFRD